jgi:uncharacterized membrane protein
VDPAWSTGSTVVPAALSLRTRALTYQCSIAVAGRRSCYDDLVREAEVRGVHDRPGVVVAAALTTALVPVGWLRHRNAWSGGLDLGIFDQAVWLLSEGRAPDVTINGRSIFADHLSPVLGLFVPLYVLAATPLWLLAGQAAALGLAVVPLRRLARDRGVDVRAVTAAYVVSAPMLAAAIFDFHPSTVAVLPLAWLVASLEATERRPVLLAAVGVLLCRADLGWIVAATAIAAPTRHRRPLLIVGVVGVAAGFAVPALFGAEGTFEIHYGHLGDSPTDALAAPWRAIEAFAAKDLATVFLWLIGCGMLVLLAPRWLAAILIAGVPVLASRWPGTEDPFTHYGAPLVPLILAGAIAGLATHHRRADARVLVGGALVATLLAGPLSPKAPEPYSVTTVFTQNFDGHLDDALRGIHPDEPLAASNRVLPHVSQRDDVYGFPIPFVTSDLAVLYGGADAEAAERIRVVIGRSEEDRAQMEELGFEVEDLGGIVVGRR